MNLQPCPLCGSGDLETGEIRPTRLRSKWMIRCHSPECGCEVSAATMAECVARWNRRPIRPAGSIPFLWNHDHHPESIIGRIEMEGPRLIVTLRDPMLQAVFDRLFPGAGYRPLEYEERQNGNLFLTRVEIVEYSLIALAPLAEAAQR